ncbi:trans-splicing intein-formed DNA polymerase III subunit alpha C-terminal partner DnaE-C [Nodularia spumigena CS-584]|jgi:DNA polymerase-3 subunit alpha|uniref:Trans-splicing intein-formed DNA polymerase III subunit alpha C-terminal partner DnaE-C n=1 Tax=Nodularia spumigena UHCC 0060 TaxID=3110300 RepID=A0ABU5USB4_NODSP|nr:trans-splicing intein-formed DNA polymerase III subunit alpha C-terminal partner DnaE-C [Nodularia spumigena]AHJ28268.1 Amino-terminal intein-mediated trans-splice / DNA polymerase III alpha subunit [Nodularia spumigena CCY9414]EAW43382.1 DNA polymerase III subunit alpha [Nodularia spumigena CCY9414]MDB9306948.1 trans-splicing intein-formed DNA polymerase III subunit alpha C-terminal partner DnaE-C [Nodularia spumigena CS-591/12]MDB9383536.1 trans-splicing intein-formed DNA polymerase III su
MVKITARKFVGRENVYDIGVERYHNFAIKNGLIASNCFNKSHSTAYGYVTYQTAYLKANYPLEYMAALLTANSGDTDKVQKYINNCVNMGITIDPPDINRSGLDFTPAAGKILFGFTAVRNVGQNAIASILSARNELGQFQSLADFCDRVDLRAVNRRTVESLIYCGAFDKIETNRQQLINDLELVYDWAQSRDKDRASGQGNIFDLLGTNVTNNQTASNAFEAVPKAQPVQDFPPQEKLRKEKELLGFYVSDHPLKSLRQAASLLSPINLSQIKEQKEDTKVCAVIMLNNVKKVMTNKGAQMAILQIEDLTAQSEAVVFSKTYERISEQLIVDVRLILWGKVARRDDQNQLIVEDVEKVEEVKMVMVELNPQEAGDIEHLHHLKTILQEQSGDKEQARTPVIGIIQSENSRQLVRLGWQFCVQYSGRTVQALQNARFTAHTKSLIDN